MSDSTATATPALEVRSISKYFESVNATVFQDLATMPLMSVWRNLDIQRAGKIMREEMSKLDIDVRDPDRTVGTLSESQTQA